MLTRNRYLSPRFFRYVSQTLYFVPLLAGAAAAWVLAAVPQMREIYLGIIEDADVLRAILGVAAIMLLSAHLYAWNASAADIKIDAIYPDHLDLQFDRSVIRMRNVKALVCAALPLLGLAWGIADIARETSAVAEQVTAIEKHFQQAAETSGAAAGPLVDGAWSGPIREIHKSIPVASVFVFAAGVAFLVLLHSLRDQLLMIWVRGGTAALGLVAMAAGWLWPEPTANAFVVIGPLASTGLALLGATLIVKGLLWLAVLVFHGLLRVAASLLMLAVWVPRGVAAAVLAAVVALAVYTPPLLAPISTKVEKDRISDDLEQLRKLELGFETDFIAWLSKRPDFDRQLSYPVFIVAAQGGGIYAASAASTFLTMMQERCPAFAEHVFAISAVSGGAVGAAIFHASLDSPSKPDDTEATVQSKACGDLDFAPELVDDSEDESIPSRTARVIRDDHLSPVFSRLLPDIVRDVVLPRTLRDAIDRYLLRIPAAAEEPGRKASESSEESEDRAHRLERSLAGSFERRFLEDNQRRRTPCPGDDAYKGGHGLDKSYHFHWCPVSTAPALVLNTTWVETGFRAPFAPFDLYHAGDGTLISTHDFGALDQVETEKATKKPIIQAAVASARFPFIAPPFAMRKKEAWWNFVDGGYADNSGSATALDIFKQLESFGTPADGKTPPKIDLHLIVLTDALADPDLQNLRDDWRSRLLSPVMTLFKVRDLLARRAVTRASREIEPHRFHKIELDHQSFKLPLGWKISGITNSIVKLMLGDPTLASPMACNKSANTADSSKELAIQTVRENSCATREIVRIIEDYRRNAADHRSAVTP